MSVAYDVRAGDIGSVDGVHPQAGTSPTSESRSTRYRCSVCGVTKSFGGTSILRGVDLDIEEGTFAVLVGPSGCGKSTLLRLVAGLESADSGTIRLADKDVTDLPPGERDIAMVFQSYALYPHLTVRDNLAFGLRLRKTPDAEIEKRIAEASSMLGLDKFMARLPKQLSGGQRQRVAMGRAIVRRPSIFLFDEPLSNLDAALRAEVRVDIRKLHDRLGATTLYVTHDQVEAMTLADTLWVLNGGLVEQKGSPLEVYNRPKSRFVATFVGSPPMNMFDGLIERRDAGVVVKAPGLIVPVDPGRFASELTDGKLVTLGVRPHDFAPAKDGEPVVGTFTVDLVEALGFEAFAYGSVDRESEKRVRTIVRLEAHGAKMKSGEQVPLGIDPERIHLFDRESGRSLAS